ncbi:FAD-binding domain-containing protein [Aspergillus ellipticus CBS 707.79]|uniref:FAD-binding domain-containing protein n=1 Tax=Aspergillus ellipticus CBS 707.79 TaxID=1448320 RepID=A0A319CWC6_9EURO|nr:FAD-binding domain-containing protein [Aspergillus ellipticus CBS 707.79]
MDPVLQTLKVAFPRAQLFFPGERTYTTLNESYFSEMEREHTPACIFLPISTLDVSTFMRRMNPFLLQGEVVFAIRSGGQQFTPGCANIRNGITMDLTLLDGAEMREGGDNVVSIGPGERWGVVYDFLTAKGLGVTGSRRAECGVGGTVLGGGMSFFSSREGFVCDNVVNFEVVLASGDIVNANEHDNADLWMALRGGGNNFGVVTRFDMRTFTQGPFFGGSVYYESWEYQHQIEELVAFLTNPETSAAKEEVHLRIGLAYKKKWDRCMAQNQVWYTQPELNAPELEPFTTMALQVENMRSLGMTTMWEASKFQTHDLDGWNRLASSSSSLSREDGPDNGSCYRCAYMNTTVKAHVQTLKAASNAFLTSATTIRNVPGLMYSMSLQPYPVSLLENSARLGGNSMGLKPSDGPLVGVVLVAYWDHEEHDEMVVGAMKWMLGTVEDEAAARKTGVPFKLMNYSSDFQNPIASYGTLSRSNMRQVSKRVDPQGIFQHYVPGRFKLLA